MAKNKVVICSKFFTFAVTKTTSRKSSKNAGCCANISIMF